MLRARETTSEDTEEEVLHVIEKPKQVDWLPDAARFSKYEVLVRSVARALDNCLRRANKLKHLHMEG